MDIKALQLAARFALPPNSLGFCGRRSAPARFTECIKQNKYEGIKEELEKFIVFNPYLETIKKITKDEKFCYKNIEAYWLGNERLEMATKNDYFNLLINFSKQGVPEWLVKELKNKVPKVFLPFHLFQLLHVGVERAGGMIQNNLDSLNNCMARWGRVAKITNNKIEIDLWSIGKKAGRYSLIKMKEKCDWEPEITPEVKKGSLVAVHWKQVVKTLDLRERQNLKYWTEQTVKYAL